jgi:regulator of RNase E activity RraA
MADALLDQYRKFDSCVVTDALDDHDVDGVVDGPTPTNPEHAAVGLATPMAFEPLEDDANANFPYAMLGALDPDRMLVFDGVTDDVSHWGGRASTLAANVGVNGLVVDGGFRDVDEIRRGDFPVFGTGRTPRTGRGRVRTASIDDPVEIDGVTVEPDDVVVADATGVVVVPEDLAGAVLETAEEILAEELLLEAKIDHGASVADLQEKSHDF